ncbi:MAG TPA: sulfurtransferase, partial [Acidimicrobiaceae bacterium]|nr:sulfurtransferase [Acidimicrobiaceae bacterium]
MIVHSERAVSTEEFGPIVSVGWLAAHFDDPDLVVVDVRWSLDAGPKRADFARGHIASAVFADLDVDLSSPASTDGGRHPLPDAVSFADAMGRLGIGDDTKVVAYDDVGGLIASRLWWMLDSLGRPAAVLDGGFAAWEGPTAEGPASPAPAVFSPVEWPVDRVITKQVLAESRDGALTILDARAPDRFANGSAVDPRPGHVPGARNAPAGTNLADGHFRSDAELAEHYGALGADGDNVV